MRVGVLLAAGASTRMGRDKALVKTGDQSFLTHGVRRLWNACDVVVVVLGARARAIRSSTEEEFRQLVGSGKLRAEMARVHRRRPEGLEVHFVDNPEWKKGMLGSVKIGLATALQLKPSSVLVQPVDHTDVKPATVVALGVAMDAALAAYGSEKKQRDFAYALVPRSGRKRGHPVAISPALGQAIVTDREANDLSDAMRRNARLVGYLDVADSGVLRNRNAPGD